MPTTLTFEFGHYRLVLDGVAENLLLTSFADRYQECLCDTVSGTQEPDLLLTSTSDGLQLIWNKEGEKPLTFLLDIFKWIASLRSFPAPKQGAFNQALGKKTRTIIDATGGWGGDALLMCTQGYQVTVIERNPVMALLLKDAMQRLSKTDWANQHDIIVPQVVSANAVEYFTANRAEVDCVYLDPMFPPKKKKSAAVNKQMKLLQWMVGEDLDAADLVAAVINAGAKRVAVKRPDYAQPLYCKPSTQFSSKLIHYDVYLGA